MAKVVAFNGSPRKNGNTSILIGHMFEELENRWDRRPSSCRSGKKKVRPCYRLHEVFREQKTALRF